MAGVAKAGVTPPPAFASAPADAKAPAQPAPERFVPQHPTVDAQPVKTLYREMDCCGNCPSWHQTNLKAPFGQCLQAIKWLGAPLYTPDLAGCTLPPEVKTKAPR